MRALIRGLSDKAEFAIVQLVAFAAAYWFARTGRLWPLIVAHVVMDFVPLWAST